MLRSALGTQFTDDDELFLEHTLLVNSAEIIAHLVVGLDVTDMQPASLLGGQRFDLAAIYGVVEHDFFDWVLEVPHGGDFVRTLARRLSRFDWTNVEHDVLKVLYESVIGSETRKQLGEYYTPDWLAEQVVSTAVTDPLNQRVLDPACGSGTFLFHAVRRYLDAAAAAGISLERGLSGLTGHVLGVDLHPVAVTLARVTYLLAIGRERLLAPDRGAITVPVYLGDSVQWNQRRDLFTEDHLVVPTGRGDQLFDAEFRFPDRFLADAAHFDRLVSSLADQAAKPRAPGQKATLPAGLLHRLAVSDADRPVVEENFRLMCQLNDPIWSYYIRNLARPAWLARPENRVDVLIGNPPWLSYRYMPDDMQIAFREMSETRQLWHGRDVATHQDLSALFVARTAQQYLTEGGSFAFVMPNAVLDRARVLFMVEIQQPSQLGLAAGGQSVRSARSSTEKMPWKELSSLEGVVEAEFIRQSPILCARSCRMARMSATSTSTCGNCRFHCSMTGIPRTAVCRISAGSVPNSLLVSTSAAPATSSRSAGASGPNSPPTQQPPRSTS
ncbi:MAG: N-6 DNA methylase [Pseudonocardiaceae bacterium]